MLSPRTTQIQADPGVWTELEIGLWLPILAGSRMYRASPTSYGDLEQRLRQIQDGTLKAKQMGATLTLIDKIGPVNASQDDGVEGIYSTLDNREDFIEYAMSVLYGNELFPLGGGTLGGQSIGSGSVTTDIVVRFPDT